jgi:hypothetical protein
MNYELDVLAALVQLSEPTTQDIVEATGISERKVQNVMKALQSNLKITINKAKDGRNIRYSITSWGVFESGMILEKELTKRHLNKGKKISCEFRKADFYESVKMSNYKESSRLEGIAININTSTKNLKKTSPTKKRSLVEKYSRYKDMSDSHG